MDRRTFLKAGLLGGLGAGAAIAGRTASAGAPGWPAGPVLLSTHPSGLRANRRAVEVLSSGGTALDAVEQGVMVIEADPEDDSVGFGGLPNADGVVELDAAILDGATLDAGAVAALREVMHPIAVARRVLERTPHVLLVGDGALRFALEQGFPRQNLLTPASKRVWQEWRRSARRPADHHDTIGMIALAADGTMAAACSTSGLAFKLPGRVGDSPLVGHGVYCDAGAGGAAATGIGEEVIKVCGSYQVVELLRQGIEPQEAIERVLRRILRRNPAVREKLVAFIALRADGTYAFASTSAGFQAALFADGENRLLDAPRVAP
jgi:L-asparaginase/N4-(beta-N-acetylglucosaminyl)-L-asparaginase